MTEVRPPAPARSGDPDAPRRIIHRTAPHRPDRAERPRVRRTVPWRLLAAVVVLGAVVMLLFRIPVVESGEGLLVPAHRTIVIFVVAVWAWVCTRLDDTFVALAAGVALVVTGVIDHDTLFATLGDDTIWLLVGAFVIAGGVSRSGLAGRVAAWLVVGARSLRGLAHLTTAAIVVTAFAIPSTAGRAALLIPIFLALASVLGGANQDERGAVTHSRAVLALALIFPSVILLSAVASLVGAGAHLVTVQVLQTATGQSFDFAQWLILGLPLAVVSSHLTTELILWMFTRRVDRRAPVSISVADIAATSSTPVSGPLTVKESRAALLLVAVVCLWCTAPIHGLDPAIVALLGALVATSPRYGSTTLKETLASVPWSLLLFMAATLALGSALVTSGAAAWIADMMLGSLQGLGPALFVAIVVTVSALAHLVIQSRSARSAVLIPIVVALSPAIGLNPAAVAFASTAAAGFCHTLPSSAKPVAMFSDIDGTPTYQRGDLLKLSVVLGPLLIALVLLFSFFVWPALGLSL